MRNGITIENKPRGIYIDGKLHREFDDADFFEKTFSKYLFFDFWEGKDSDIYEGDVSTNSMFSFFSGCAPMPCCTEVKRFTCFDDPRFAAGYLKYIVLGNMAINLLLTDEEYESLYTFDYGEVRFIKTPDVDDLIELCIKNDGDRFKVLDKMQHIIRLCNLVFYEQDRKKQKEYLVYAAETFNEYFKTGIEENTGWNYEFTVYDGADAVKDRIFEYLNYLEELQKATELFTKPIWENEDKDTLMDLMNRII